MMNLRHARHFFFFATLTLIGTGLSFTLVLTEKRVAYAKEGMEVLTHGPIHEAFAETVEFDSQEGMIVKEAPPEPIEEFPPDQIPEGEDVKWIPGYWAWDDEMNDYIWVSGFWRAPPPGREWVPGYWVRTSEGFQWVSGYWGKAGVDETQYLPEPPETVESGPNVYAPSPDYGWIPGCWIWSRGRYFWRPGYWARMQRDWIWVPAHYEWTPRGYIFVGGYRDHVIPHRGILFAPVYFGFNIHMRHGFRYSPFMVINLDIFLDSLFLRPRYCHYYFGDYYDARYYQRGFYPWFSPHARRHGYVPFYTHQRWKHRNNHDWERRIQDNYRHRRDHRDARPSRSLASMADMRSKGWKTKDGRNLVVKPLAYVSKNRDTSWRFKLLDKDERKRIGQGEKDISNYRKKRHDWETIKTDSPKEWSQRGFEPAKVKTPRSPIKSKSHERYKERKALSNRYKEPKPDPNVEPLKRSYDYDRRDSREKDSERRRNSDDRQNKRNDRRIRPDDSGRKTDERSLKTEDRGVETRWNTGRKTGNGGKKFQVREQSTRTGVRSNRLGER